MSKFVLSRRDFLKLGGYGLMGMLLPNLSLPLPDQDDFDNLQGRVIDRTIWMYDEPDFRAKRLRLYWHDLILPITNTTIGEDEAAYNRVWYQVADGGYVYSGGVQPVRTILNEPQPIPPRGALGEVSVPYTEARLEADPNAEVVYRLYYESVHWVAASARNGTDGSVWYSLRDDKNHTFYYVIAGHIRLLTPEELAPLSTHVPGKEKLVEV